MTSAEQGPAPVTLTRGELWEASACTTRVAPPFDPATWRLAITGAVQRPLALDYPTLLAWPARAEAGDLRCGHGAVIPAGLFWEGVAVRDVLALAEPLTEADTVLVHSPGYVKSVPLADLQEDGALLAYRLNGQPLTREHGAPLRLVVSRLAARFNVKWVERLELVAAAVDQRAT